MKTLIEKIEDFSIFYDDYNNSLSGNNSIYIEKEGADKRFTGFDFILVESIESIDDRIKVIKNSDEYKSLLSGLDTFENWIKRSIYQRSRGVELNNTLKIENGKIRYTKKSGETVCYEIPKRFLNISKRYDKEK